MLLCARLRLGLMLNGPGSAVPSHGLHAYGQTYAMDLVYAMDRVTG